MRSIQNGSCLLYTSYIPLDRLYLSPQCGFASCEIGNKLTEEEQWAKLALVKEIAEEVLSESGNLILVISHEANAFCPITLRVFGNLTLLISL